MIMWSAVFSFVLPLYDYVAFPYLGFSQNTKDDGEHMWTDESRLTPGKICSAVFSL